MRKLVSILMAVLCVATGHAKDSIMLNNEQWDAIINYVAVEMTKAAMSKAKKQPDSTSYNNHFKNIGDGTIKDSGFYKFMEKLCSKEGECWSNAKKDPFQKLIDYKYTGCKNLDSLQTFIKGLRGYTDSAVVVNVNEQIEYYVSKIAQEHEKIKITSSDNNMDNDTNNTDNSESNGGSLADILIAFLVGVVSAVVSVVMLIRKGILNYKALVADNNDMNEVKQDSHKNEGNEEIKRLESKVSELEGLINNFKKKENEHQSEINRLKKELREKENEAEEVCYSVVDDRKEEPKKEENNTKWRYLRRLSGDTFKAISETMTNDSYYVLDKETMEFKFAEDNMERALMNQTSTFPQSIVENVASSVSEPKRVRNIEAGKVQMVDGEWKVVKKVKLKFE